MALERAIARLERHPELAEHLVFKGGFVLLKMFESTRFTRDADALATGISKEVLKKLVSESLANDLKDGLWFGNLQVQEIPEQDKYGAYRFDCAFQIGEPELNKVHKLSRVHIDVGFSDKLPVKPELETMPSVLKHEEPVSWKVYPIEFMVAEKLETLFDRGSANSRAKDIYDLVYLFPKCKDEAKLSQAISSTFDNRHAPLPDSFVAAAQAFDKTILASSWPSVKLVDEKMGFEEAWDALLGHLGELDK